MKTCRRLPHAVWLSAALIGLAAGPVLAESACKGVEQAQCKGMTDCTWVDGYTRKDGVNVSGHCKAIGKHNAAAAKKAAAPADQGKTPPAMPAAPAMGATPPAKPMPQ